MTTNLLDAVNELLDAGFSVEEIVGLVQQTASAPVTDLESIV